VYTSFWITLYYEYVQYIIHRRSLHWLAWTHLAGTTPEHATGNREVTLGHSSIARKARKGFTVPYLVSFSAHSRLSMGLWSLHFDSPTSRKYPEPWPERAISSSEPTSRRGCVLVSPVVVNINQLLYKVTNRELHISPVIIHNCRLITIRQHTLFVNLSSISGFTAFVLTWFVFRGRTSWHCQHAWERW
jgi:hypothetical protein